MLVDKVNRLVYKDFVIAEHEQEEFEQLLGPRRRLTHPNLA